MPVAPDPLETWAVGDRLLTAGLAGLPADQAVRAELLRGQVPPGPARRRPARPRRPDRPGAGRAQRRHPYRRARAVRRLGRAAVGHHGGRHGAWRVRRLRRPGRLLPAVGQAPHPCLGAAARARRAVAGPAVGGQDRRPRRQGLQDQAGHRLALAPARRHRRGRPRAPRCARPPVPRRAARAAADATEVGVRLRREARRVARPQGRREQGPERVAQRLGERAQGECTDAHHQRIWGDAEIDVLLATPPDPADTAWPDEPHRFGQLARTVWAPLLAAEEVHSR
ncbi:MAG: hypothetical protein WKF83_10905 [Nocardioidaceae bacterium]